MAKISETYQVGDITDLEQLARILEDMYRTLAIAVNRKPDIYQRNTNGLFTDTSLNNGDININTTTQKVEMLTAHPTQTSVTWTQLS